MLKQIVQTTNASKAQLILAINAVFAALVVFHVALTQAQIGAVDLAVNAVLSLFVGLTYTQSSKRIEPPK